MRQWILTKATYVTILAVLVLGHVPAGNASPAPRSSTTDSVLDDLVRACATEPLCEELRSSSLDVLAFSSCLAQNLDQLSPSCSHAFLRLRPDITAATDARDGAHTSFASSCDPDLRDLCERTGEPETPGAQDIACLLQHKHNVTAPCLLYIHQEQFWTNNLHVQLDLEGLQACERASKPSADTPLSRCASFSLGSLGSSVSRGEVLLYCLTNYPQTSFGECKHSLSTTKAILGSCSSISCSHEDVERADTLSRALKHCFSTKPKSLPASCTRALLHEGSISFSIREDSSFPWDQILLVLGLAVSASLLIVGVTWLTLTVRQRRYQKQQEQQFIELKRLDENARPRRWNLFGFGKKAGASSIVSPSSAQREERPSRRDSEELDPERNDLAGINLAEIERALGASVDDLVNESAGSSSLESLGDVYDFVDTADAHSP